MYADTVDALVVSANKKANLLKDNPAGYFLASMLAGLYVGFGIVLIFSLGADLFQAHSPFLKVIMGASFGVALSLVIFAGSELFTGNAMTMAFGFLAKKSRARDVLSVWVFSWLGNLAGSLSLAFVVVKSGALNPALPFIAKIAAAKMSASPLDLILKGILCNTLVCLAVWTSTKTQGEAAKLILIWWCLFAFIGSGFEHSIANMTLLAMGLFGNPTDSALSWGGYFYNLGWVTLGNTIAGVFVLALPYHQISRRKALKAA